MPWLEISREEAETLSATGSELAKHYAIVVSEKHAAIASFLFAVGTIYGPRALITIGAIKAAKMAARSNAARPADPPASDPSSGAAEGIMRAGAGSSPGLQDIDGLTRQ